MRTVRRRSATKDIIDVLSVTGGVPRYLEEINPSLSAAENIRAMCFVPKAPLRVDFDEMFGDVITRQPRLAEKVLRSLVDGPLTLTEIADVLGIGKGGDISKSLEQLCESGSGRLDLGVKYCKATYAVEVKTAVNYAKSRDKAHQQILRYMDSLGVAEGWLVVADTDLTKPWDDKISTADVSIDGKSIHIVRC